MTAEIRAFRDHERRRLTVPIALRDSSWMTRRTVSPSRVGVQIGPSCTMWSTHPTPGTRRESMSRMQ